MKKVLINNIVHVIPENEKEVVKIMKRIFKKKLILSQGFFMDHNGDYLHDSLQGFEKQISKTD